MNSASDGNVALGRMHRSHVTSTTKKSLGVENGEQLLGRSTRFTLFSLFALAFFRAVGEEVVVWGGTTERGQRARQLIAGCLLIVLLGGKEGRG